MVDIEGIRASVSLSNLATDFGVSLRKNGNEWEGLCPFHDERTPSFSIFTGKDNVERFHCFGCGEKGDVIDFVKALKAVDLKGAVEILGGDVSRPNVERKKVEARDPYAGIERLVPQHGIRAGQTVRLYNPKREYWANATPSMVFPYYRSGVALGYVLRNEMRDGSKETPMVCWCRMPDGTEGWARYPFPKPRPLYFGGGYSALREGQVIVVEGEKCADAMVAATGRQAVTWAGGTHGVQHADWSMIAGRSVVIWPDADGPGVETADRIAAALTALACTVKILQFGVAA